MSGHTKGPWFVEQSEKTPIYVSPVGRHENISICNVLTMDEDESESGDWINGDETKANAHLIAAAPDLLDALELLLVDAENQSEALDMEFGSKLRPRKEPYTFDIARAAIARAKGEQV